MDAPQFTSTASRLAMTCRVEITILATPAMVRRVRACLGNPLRQPL